MNEDETTQTGGPEAADGTPTLSNTDTGPEEAGDDLFDPAALPSQDKSALLTALLFSSGEVVPADRLAEFLGLDAGALTLLAEELAGELRLIGLDILYAAGGLRLVTASQWDSYLAAFHRQIRKAKLSKSALEILAVIAYEQPVTRIRVDELRQVNSESTIRTLLDRRLVTVAGRSETPGRPFLYRTTEKFLEVFGLTDLDDLPPRPASLDLAREGVSLGLRSEDTDGEPGLADLPTFEEADELED